MRNSNFFENLELQEVDDADDTVYEYGLPEEEEGGFIGTLSNLVAPARREVIKAPEEKQVPLEELGMDSIPGETMTVKTPGEYGPVETDFSYAPIVRGAKSVLDYGKKLFSDEQTQEDTVQALKAAPAAAVEGGGKFLEDQMAAAMGMSAGYSYVNRPDGEVARYDPLAFTGAVAPAGIAATSTAKAGETVLGIFGSATGRTAAKRFEKYNDEVEKLEKSGRVHKKKDNKDTFLFRKSDGVFLDEEDIPRFEMSTKDVELLPYFKKRNAVAGKENTFKINPDPQMKSDLMLPDVIKFDELFNEYPQLKSVKVIDMPEREGYENTAAYYASDTKEIAVRASDEKQFISSILHEIQHAVDDIELLPGGSSPDMFKGKAKSTEEFFEYLDQQSKYINKRNAFKEKFKRAMSEKLTEQEKEILDDPKEMDKLFLNLAGIDDTPEYISLNNITTGKMERVFNNRYGNLQNKIMDYVNEQDNFEIIEPVLEDVQGFIYDKIKFDYANDQIKKRKYRQTPGEVDARNVSRRFLNPALQKYLPSKTADIEKDFSVNKEIEKYMDAESRVLEFVEPLEIGTSPATEGGKLLANYTADTAKDLTEKAKNAKVGLNPELIGKKVDTGKQVAIRLNLNSSIPNAPKGLDKLQTLHDKKPTGSALSYLPFATVENVNFFVNQTGRRDIASKIKGLAVKEAKNKFPAMSVNGQFNPTRNVLEEMGDDVVEIGFNPANTHLFVDMATGQAVKGADVATVIGNRVYAKGVTYMKKSEAPEAKVASDGTELGSEVRYKFKRGGLMARR